MIKFSSIELALSVLVIITLFMACEDNKDIDNLFPEPTVDLPNSPAQDRDTLDGYFGDKDKFPIQNSILEKHTDLTLSIREVFPVITDDFPDNQSGQDTSTMQGDVGLCPMPIQDLRSYVVVNSDTFFIEGTSRLDFLPGNPFLANSVWSWVTEAQTPNAPNYGDYSVYGVLLDGPTWLIQPIIHRNEELEIITFTFSGVSPRGDIEITSEGFPYEPDYAHYDEQKESEGNIVNTWEWYQSRFSPSTGNYTILIKERRDGPDSFVCTAYDSSGGGNGSFTSVIGGDSNQYIFKFETTLTRYFPSKNPVDRVGCEEDWSINGNGANPEELIQVSGQINIISY